MMKLANNAQNGLFVLLVSAAALACGGGAPPNAATASATPTDKAATPTDSTIPKGATKPDSDKCTWKKDASKSCHIGAKADGDLVAAATSMANGCFDTKKMKMMSAATTGSGTPDKMVTQTPLSVKAGHCYRIIGIAEKAITDFDIAIMDSAGKSCGEDLNDSNEAVVLEDGVICFSQDDTVSVNAAVAAGQGKWAFEVWSD